LLWRVCTGLRAGIVQLQFYNM